MRGRRPAPQSPTAAEAAKPRPSVKALAVRMLARREYARGELALRLRRRGEDPEAIERALDELERLGYLSDERFARGVVAQRAGRFAKRAIAHELKERGIAGSTTSEALAALDSRDELADASTLWQRRFRSAPKDEREKARQVRFLLSRGYSVATALKVLRTAGLRSDDDDASQSAPDD